MSSELAPLVFASMLVGCGYPVPVTLHVEDEWTEDERQVIDDSVQDWHRATGAMVADLQIIHGFVWPGPFRESDWRGNPTHIATVHRALSADPGWGNRDAVVGGVHMHRWNGGSDHDTAIAIAVDRLLERCGPKYYLRCLKTTFMHELGHMFGLPHLDAGLMLPGHGEPCIDQVTLDAFCDQHECVEPVATCLEK